MELLLVGESGATESGLVTDPVSELEVETVWNGTGRGQGMDWKVHLGSSTNT